MRVYYDAVVHLMALEHGMILVATKEVQHDTPEIMLARLVSRVRDPIFNRLTYSPTLTKMLQQLNPKLDNPLP